MNEQLIDVLVGTGRVVEAVAAAESALAARRKLFGDTALVVAQSELRVAQVRAVTLCALAPCCGSCMLGSPVHGLPGHEKVLSISRGIANVRPFRSSNFWRSTFASSGKRSLRRLRQRLSPALRCRCGRCSTPRRPPA